jgi:hypothetical protein
MADNYWLLVAERRSDGFSQKAQREVNIFPGRHTGSMHVGGKRCPQRIGKVTAALPPEICAFGDSFAIVFSRPRVKLRRAKGEADPPCYQKRMRLITILIAAAESDAVAASGEVSALLWE